MDPNAGCSRVYRTRVAGIASGRSPNTVPAPLVPHKRAKNGREVLVHEDIWAVRACGHQVFVGIDFFPTDQGTVFEVVAGSGCL
jgi:hypothetical protein